MELDAYFSAKVKQDLLDALGRLEAVSRLPRLEIESPRGEDLGIRWDGCCKAQQDKPAGLGGSEEADGERSSREWQSVISESGRK